MEQFLVPDGKEKQFLHGMKFYSIVNLDMLLEFLEYVKKSRFKCSFAWGGMRLYNGGDYARIGSAYHTFNFRFELLRTISIDAPSDDMMIRSYWLNRPLDVYEELICDLLLQGIYIDINVACYGAGVSGYEIASRAFTEIYKYFRGCHNKYICARFNDSIPLPQEISRVIYAYVRPADKYPSYISPFLKKYFGAVKINMELIREIHISIWNQFKDIMIQQMEHQWCFRRPAAGRAYHIFYSNQQKRTFLP